MVAKAITTVSKVAAGIALVLTGSVVAGKTKSGPDSSRRVCKSLVRAGSHIPKRLCLTQQEWDEAARRVQDSVFKHQRDGSIKPDPSAVSAGGESPR